MSMVAEAEREDGRGGFNKSLLELKHLCSQLHQAADYCQSSFLNADNKTSVVDRTKEYVCRAVVTVVDHLGTVSANLDYELSKAYNINQTQLRIHSLQQRLVTCQDYCSKLDLARYGHGCLKPQIARYHPRYLSPPVVVHPKSHQFMRESRSEIVSVSKNSCKIDEEVPLFLYTYNYKPTLTEDSGKHNNVEKTNHVAAPVLPVKDGLPAVPKPQPCSFHFQETRRAKRKMLTWKSMTDKDMLSFIRRRK